MFIAILFWLVKAAWRNPLPAAVIAVGVVFGLPRVLSTEALGTIMATLFVLFLLVGWVRMETRNRDKHTVNRPD